MRFIQTYICASCNNDLLKISNTFLWAASCHDSQIFNYFHLKRNKWFNRHTYSRRTRCNKMQYIRTRTQDTQSSCDCSVLMLCCFRTFVQYGIRPILDYRQNVNRFSSPFFGSVIIKRARFVAVTNSNKSVRKNLSSACFNGAKKFRKMNATKKNIHLFIFK